MHQLQILELTLWGFLTRGIKAGSSPEQGMMKVARWNGTTIGNLIRGLKSQPHWPAGMIEQLELAAETCNYLAHHFLREYFVVTPSEEVKETASGWLADISAWLEALDERLEAHLESLGIERYEDLDERTLAEMERLRPTEWTWPGT